VSVSADFEVSVCLFYDDGDPAGFSCRSGQFHAGLLESVRHVPNYSKSSLTGLDFVENYAILACCNQVGNF